MPQEASRVRPQRRWHGNGTSRVKARRGAYGLGAARLRCGSGRSARGFRSRRGHATQARALLRCYELSATIRCVAHYNAEVAGSYSAHCWSRVLEGTRVFDGQESAAIHESLTVLLACISDRDLTARSIERCCAYTAARLPGRSKRGYPEGRAAAYREGTAAAQRRLSGRRAAFLTDRSKVQIFNEALWLRARMLRGCCTI